MIPVMLSQIYPPEMAMSGYVKGEVRRYALGGSRSGYEIDSVVSIGSPTWIGCILPTGSQIVTVKTWNPDSSRVDTFYAYYNTFYFVEFFKKPYFGLDASLSGRGIAIRSLKFPITPGDRWPAYDWCGPQPGDIYGMGDIDGNGLPDSIVFMPSEMWYEYVSPDTDTVITAGSIGYYLLYSFRDTVRYVSDTNYTVLLGRWFRHYDYIHFTYIKNVGYVEYRVDSSEVYYYSRVYHKSGRLDMLTTTLDSTATLYDLYSRTREPLNVAENTGRERPTLTVKGRRVYIRCGGCPYSIYASDGRMVRAGTSVGETSIPLKASIYFVKVANGVERVIIR